MGTLALRNRSIWQDVTGIKAENAEKNLYSVLENAFENTDFKIRSKPREFKNVYNNVTLDEHVIKEIYNPNESWIHGVIPDYAIDNVVTGKTLYVENKRQDGWVEGKERKAGRGNAHERSCKYFTPGLLKILREKGKLGDDVLPFWTVFQGDIARDPKRVREITCWYEGYSSHFFLWHNSDDNLALINHFNNKLKNLLL